MSGPAGRTTLTGTTLTGTTLTGTTLTGTAALAGLALRSDRVQLPVWVAALTLVQVATVSSITDLYGTQEERLALALSTAGSPAAVIFNGIVSGTSLGATAVTQSFVFVTLGAALMTTLGVARHTRADEELGRAELVGAAAVGRHAPLMAALVVIAGANLAVGLVQAVVLLAAGLPVKGSVVTGAAIASVGVLFAGVAAVTAQVASSSRTANFASGAVIAAAFALRALGDASGSVAEAGTRTVSGWPSWLSPIGWGQQVRPYDEDAWWLLGLPLLAALLLLGAAFAVRSHRDLGAGLVADRPGPAVAPPSLAGPLGLAWRLHRGLLTGWLVVVALLGLGYGAVGTDLEALIESSDQMAELFAARSGGASLEEIFFATALGFFGLAAAGYAVQALLRMRSEETRGHLEPVLATSVSRVRWLASHLAVAAAGVVLLLVVGGACTGLAYGLAVGDPLRRAPELALAALVQAPAALVLAGLPVAAFGLVPRWTAPVSWSALAACALLVQLGLVLGLPDLVLQVSPFSHVPAAPAEAVTAAPLLALTAVAAALCALGAGAFRRRDLEA